jgi:uncharacterized membrane protein
MVDRLFSDAALAALYDTFGAGRRDFGFYLPIVMSAQSVLDVGCGTGALLRTAREAGHTGRLCGLDPADAMLRQARKRSDVEWILGDLSGVTWDRQFDLVLMTGHAFQVFIEDDELRVAVGSVLSLIAAAMSGLWALGGADRLLLIAAALVYLLCVQLPTATINIPLNNALQKLDPSTMSETMRKHARDDFEPRWNRWNAIRTACASLTSILLLILLFRA